MSKIALMATRNEGETWREAAERHGREWGLHAEVVEAFDEHVATGETEDRACWMALWDWDCLAIGEVPNEHPAVLLTPEDVGGRR